ncbi:MAG: Na+ dependent nucleoside transporter N-terminal domain-containing protein, partial [Aeromonas veronii]
MAALILIAVLASTNRKAIRLRTVGLALTLQVTIGAL